MTVTMEGSPLLSKPVAIVTGANAGMGFFVAGMLAGKAGYHVVLACRNRQRGEQAVKDLKEKHGKDAELSCEILDLATSSSVLAFATAFRKQHQELKLLVCNGGMGTAAAPTEPSKQLSAEEGVDVLYQTNYLSHFLLTCALLPLLQAGKGRVVNLTSAKHRKETAESLALVKKVREPYTDLYSFSKLAQLSSSLEFDRRFGKNVDFHNVNPGGVASNIWDGKPAFQRWLFTTFLNSPETAASTIFKVCICEEGVGSEPKMWNGYKAASCSAMGEYWGPFASHETLVETEPSDVAKDPGFGKTLWQESIATLQAAGVKITDEGDVSLAEVAWS